MDKNRVLCMELAKSENEEEIIKLLKASGYWDDDSSWEFCGDVENNYSTIGNQQNQPESALAEKIINSVDHMLIKECKIRGINPESGDAPKTIKEAVEKLFDVNHGTLSYISSAKRNELSENIMLVATGKKTNPCYTIIDKGEGQTPSKIPDTFLSIAKSNKLRIPFVQGKFNMGGTGALRFCGQNNIQLIISKKCPKIPDEKDPTYDKWGFTIIRRENPSEGRRSSVYRYLAPSKKILSFKSKSLNLMPGKYPNKFGNDLEYGSFIKLYEYNMTGLKTNVVFDLYNRLSVILPNIALPIRLYERRKGYSGHTLETTMSGISVRLDDDKRNNLEPGFPSSFEIVSMGQRMECSLFAFKKDASEKYRKDEGIIFAINGQTHGYLATRFFSKKSIGMSYLSDSLLVIIDCSRFEGRQVENLFMNSRDRLSDCPLKHDIENQLGDVIRQHKGLRELRERRRREEIQNKLGDSKPLADVLNDIIKKSPSLASLFNMGNKIQNPFNLTDSGYSKDFIGKEFPTYFKLSSKIKNKSCPINRRFRVSFETDASNNYFERPEYPGEFILETNGGKIEDYTLNLWNGLATLTVKFPKISKIGDTIEIKSRVIDETQIKPFEEEFEVSILPEQIKNTGDPGNRIKPPSEKGKGRKSMSMLSLPRIIEVRKPEWDSHKFDEKSALKTMDTGEDGYDFYVNMDNIYLLHEIKKNSSIEPNLIQDKFKYALTLIGLALIKDYEEKNGEDTEIDIYKEVGKITSSLSPIILPMISYLGELEISE